MRPLDAADFARRCRRRRSWRSRRTAPRLGAAATGRRTSAAVAPARSMPNAPSRSPALRTPAAGLEADGQRHLVFRGRPAEACSTRRRVRSHPSPTLRARPAPAWLRRRIAPVRPGVTADPPITRRPTSATRRRLTPGDVAHVFPAAPRPGRTSSTSPSRNDGRRVVRPARTARETRPGTNDRDTPH